MAHGISVVSVDADRIEDYAGRLRTAVSSETVEVLTWWEASPATADVIGMREASSNNPLLIIFVASAFGGINTMLMSVFERTRELGVLRALGMGPAQLVALVMLETGSLTVVACLVGVPIGLAGVAYLVHVGLDLSAVMEGFSMMGMNFNTRWMGEFHAHKLALTVVGLFVIAFGSAAWPAVRAARLRPIEAMRQE